MHHPSMASVPPPSASASSSSGIITDQHQLNSSSLQLHHYPYHSSSSSSYALQQSHPPNQAMPPPPPFLPLPSSITDSSSASSSTASFPLQFHHLYSIGNGQVAGQHQQLNATSMCRMTEMENKVKDEQKQQKEEEQRKRRTKSGEDGGGGSTGTMPSTVTDTMPTTMTFPYGAAIQPHQFGAMSDYGGAVIGTDWMGPTHPGQAANSYPIPSSVPHQMAPPPPCPLPLGLEELNAMYGPNGLMALPPAGLHYEIDPTMSAYGGVWPGTGYYLNGDQTKLLGDPQQYLNGGTVEARYCNGGEGGVGQQNNNNNNGNNPGATMANNNAFYNAIHQQDIPPSALPPLVDSSMPFSLPPAPSQLSDQLYGQPLNTFTSIGVPPPPPPPPLASDSSSIIASALLPPPNPAPPLPHPLDQQHFYSNQFDGISQLESTQPPTNSTNLAIATKEIVVEKGHKKNGKVGHHNSSPSHRQNPTKRGRSSAASMRAAAGTSSQSAMGRPSTSQGMVGMERGEERATSRKSNSRSRSVVKEGSDDEKSTEEKEQERRNANNTRERIRVRDINAAFKELARLCAQHMPNVDGQLTKLNTLLKAVELIPLLEKRVEEKNQMMSARKECIKHRLDAPPPLSMGGPLVPESFDGGPSAHQSTSMSLMPANLTALQGHGQATR